MIKITCLICGKTSDNPYEFGNKRFTYTDETHMLKTIHLCKCCKDELNHRINVAIAAFLCEEEIAGFEENRGIV